MADVNNRSISHLCDSCSCSSSPRAPWLCNHCTLPRLSYFCTSDRHILFFFGNIANSFGFNAFGFCLQSDDVHVGSRQDLHVMHAALLHGGCKQSKHFTNSLRLFLFVQSVLTILSHSLQRVQSVALHPNVVFLHAEHSFVFFNMLSAAPRSGSGSLLQVVISVHFGFRHDLHV